MKFKRGSKVEVFSKKEVSSGSWYPGEIIHGNGHYYTVKHDGGIGVLGEQKFERVPRKAIRPCPPVMQSMEDWASGQIAEVFHCFSWKMATVLRILNRDRLLVRLIGSSHGIEVRKIDIRSRLCWQHDEWKVIRKIPDNCKQAPESIPYQSLKRKLRIFHSSIGLPSQKIRVIGNHNKQNQFISTHQVQLPEKVDAIASSRAMKVETCMLSINNKLTGLSRSCAMSLDFRGEDSIDSSVASCSISRNNICTGSFECDAESCYQMESEDRNSLVPAGNDLMEAIHRIELLAYRNTIEAFHASGPLSWEQESLLTNLRVSLHISNDEHLMEVRNVLSSTSSPDC